MEGITAELNKNIDKIPPELQISYQDIKLDPKTCGDFNHLANQLGENLTACGKLLQEDIAAEENKKNRTRIGYLKDFAAWVRASTKLVGAYITKRNNPQKYKEAIRVRNEASDKARMYSKELQKRLKESATDIWDSELLRIESQRPLR
ncbi:MAG: hypothetical protein EB127_22010 [Alphaproteobacteria bacterium]|nr:hypothetical protein [Alphaproteobacteria bacterium]